MNRRTFIYLFWILSTRKYTWKYVYFCIVFESLKGREPKHRSYRLQPVMKVTEFLKSKYHQYALQYLCNEVLIVSLGKNFFRILSWAEDWYCCYQWELWWWLDWKQDSPFPLASCDVWQADHIPCANSSTFSLTLEIASILLQGNNNLQIKMPKCCTCFL